MQDPAGAIGKFIAGRRAAQTRFLAELVKVPSDNPPGDCRPNAQRAAALLAELGFEVEQHPVPEAAVRAAGMISCTNLIVRERFSAGGPVIALNAHGDVVPPGLGWSTNPYGAEIHGDAMIGRGVAVSKSDFATYAFALLSLKNISSQLRGSVELHFTYDEETGGELGPAWLLAQALSKPDFAISAGFTHGITIAHSGCLHLEVAVIGRSGHAARPETGIDALEAATGIMAGLYAFRGSFSAKRSATPGITQPTLVIGLVSGGINTNVVPDHVSFRLDRRIVPEEDPAEAERALRGHLRELAANWPGIRLEVKRILLARPFTPLPGQEKLVAALRKNAQRVLGEKIEAQGAPLYTDARHYSAAGIPTVLYGAGPRTLEEANGHMANEKLQLDDLYKATEVIALTLLDFLRSQK